MYFSPRRLGTFGAPDPEQARFRASGAQCALALLGHMTSNSQHQAVGFKLPATLQTPRLRATDSDRPDDATPRLGAIPPDGRAGVAVAKRSFSGRVQVGHRKVTGAPPVRAGCCPPCLSLTWNRPVFRSAHLL